jgi:hypothetical protein
VPLPLRVIDPNSLTHGAAFLEEQSVAAEQDDNLPVASAMPSVGSASADVPRSVPVKCTVPSANAVKWDHAALDDGKFRDLGPYTGARRPRSTFR